MDSSFYEHNATRASRTQHTPSSKDEKEKNKKKSLAL